MYVKWSHLIIGVIVLFVAYYLWVDNAGRHGTAPVFAAKKEAVTANQ
jgi:hypothetical protein